MRIQFHKPALSILFSAAVLASGAIADTIYLTDGSTLSDVRIKEEGLLAVSYKEGKGNKTIEVASDTILKIEFSRKPDLVDQAEQDVLDDLLAGAVDFLENYVEGVAGKTQKTYPWAPAYAMFRLVELNEIMGESEKVVVAADRLIERAPDSRYVPIAVLKKAEALSDLKKGSDARAALAGLQALVASKGLSEVWNLECKVRDVMFDTSLKGKSLRSKLENIVSESDAYPLVRNRAMVALGESWLDDKKLSDAESIFKVVVRDANADSRTMAAAYMGMGDCLFQRGSGSKDQVVLEDALMNYMRIVVSHKNELRYVPRAMFQAGRVFQHLDAPEAEARAQKLYTRLLRNFRGSRWADEARGFRK